MTREQKIKKDERTLAKYEEQLQKMPKEYMQSFSAFSINQRRSRAAAVGELALQAMDAVRGLRKIKPLMANSLTYGISEKKVEDPDGKKGFEYAVTFHVFSDEPRFTEEEIKAEIEDTRRRMMTETDVMFPEEEKKNDETENHKGAE